MNILIVEDDLDTLDLLSELLMMQGHEVVAASDSRQALSILNNRPDINLMVTDISLPGMSGIELACTARSLRADLRIVVCSGYEEKQFDTLPCEVEWIEKPVEIEAFLGTIARFSEEDQ
jgi:CheY-like chemotaxis protein